MIFILINTRNACIIYLDLRKGGKHMGRRKMKEQLKLSEITLNGLVALITGILLLLIDKYII